MVLVLSSISADHRPPDGEAEGQILLAVDAVAEVLAVDVDVDRHGGPALPEVLRPPAHLLVGDPAEAAGLRRRGGDGDRLLAAARSAIGSSKMIAIGWATPTVMPSVGNELAAVLLSGTTVVKLLASGWRRRRRSCRGGDRVGLAVPQLVGAGRPGQPSGASVPSSGTCSPCGLVSDTASRVPPATLTPIGASGSTPSAPSAGGVATPTRVAAGAVARVCSTMSSTGSGRRVGATGWSSGRRRRGADEVCRVLASELSAEPPAVVVEQPASTPIDQQQQGPATPVPTDENVRISHHRDARSSGRHAAPPETR